MLSFAQLDLAIFHEWDRPIAAGLFAVSAFVAVWLLRRLRAARRRIAADIRVKKGILETSLDGIVIIDDHGTIVDFNPAAERIFGHSRGDVVGRQLADVLIPTDLRDQHAQGFARHLRTGVETVLGKRLEMTALRADGKEFPIELAVGRIESSARPLFVGFIRDITERKRAEKKYQILNDTLEERVIERTRELREALADIKNLHRLLPICAWCKKVRDDGNYWHEVETYIAANTDMKFSHGMCPDCLSKHKPAGPVSNPDFHITPLS